MLTFVRFTAAIIALVTLPLSIFLFGGLIGFIGWLFFFVLTEIAISRARRKVDEDEKFEKLATAMIIAQRK